MPEGSQDDVVATLSQLESKLIALERELLQVAGGPAADALMPPPAEPIAAPPAPEPAAALDAPSPPAIAAELTGFRDHLRSVADDLVARVDALLASLEPGARD
jgi:hypothetical protein